MNSSDQLLGPHWQDTVPRSNQHSISALCTSFARGKGQARAFFCKCELPRAEQIWCAFLYGTNSGTGLIAGRAANWPARSKRPQPLSLSLIALASELNARSLQRPKPLQEIEFTPSRMTACDGTSGRDIRRERSRALGMLSCAPGDACSRWPPALGLRRARGKRFSVQSRCRGRLRRGCGHKTRTSA